MGLYKYDNSKSYWECKFCGETDYSKKKGDAICEECWIIYIRKDKTKSEKRETLRLLEKRGINANTVIQKGTIFDVEKIKRKYKKNNKKIKTKQNNKEINKIAKLFHGKRKLIENDVFDFNINEFKLRGIYFLLDESNHVIYVGQSEFIPSRINTHIKNKEIQFSSVKIKLIENTSKKLLDIESFYIKKYLPRYNTCAKSIRLKREHYKNKEINYEKNIPV